VEGCLVKKRHWKKKKTVMSRWGVGPGEWQGGPPIPTLWELEGKQKKKTVKAKKSGNAENQKVGGVEKETSVVPLRVRAPQKNFEEGMTRGGENEGYKRDEMEEKVLDD